MIDIFLHFNYDLRQLWYDSENASGEAVEQFPSSVKPRSGVVPLTERNNEQWIKALSQPGPSRETALKDLRALLVRGLGFALAKHHVDKSQTEDFVQEALIKILNSYDSFRGESRFTTWAQTVAVRVAFTEMRRLRWRDVSLDQMVESTEFDPDALVDRSAGPEKQALQEMILKLTRKIINEELTEKQRQALAPDLVKGIPQEEVARRTGTNRNAYYKMMYDARQKLKKSLLSRGLTREQIQNAFDL
ncbi:sigma-70 family RNA polymerase sigma factor [Candidatus Acetothermia bacterium]|nr:sigma-70 family RNA polymerase sigma factor [Candidatus Acetothermia bacterium]